MGVPLGCRMANQRRRNASWNESVELASESTNGTVWGRSTQDIESSLDALRGNLDTVLSQAAVCELHPFIGFGFIA